MSKKIAIGVIIICVLGSVISGYGFSQIRNVNSVVRYFYGISSAVFGFTALIIGYLSLLNYVKKGVRIIDSSKFIQFPELSRSKFGTEIIPFYFVPNTTENVTFSILNREMKELSVLHEGVLNPLGAEILVDTQLFESGAYFCQITSKSQKIMRKFNIQHTKKEESSE
jgi:hypothetical protein